MAQPSKPGERASGPSPPTTGGSSSPSDSSKVPRPKPNPAGMSSSTGRSATPASHAQSGGVSSRVSTGYSIARPAGDPSSSAHQVARVTPRQSTPRSNDAGRDLVTAEVKGVSVVDRERARLTPGEDVPGTPYKIVRWLGDTAMGVVYVAEDTQRHRQVAFEVFRPDAIRDARVLKMARAEARVASGLRCPQVVEVYEFGELQDGRVMVVRELVEESSLVSEVGQVDGPRLVMVLRHACKALAAVHSVGVVHGDIKPETLHPCALDGRPGAIKIGAFGMASLLDDPSELGKIAGGTPHYLAPERLEGSPRTPVADIYALGCVAYELLAGRPPFVADRVQDIRHGHLRRPAEPLSAVSKRKIHPALERVVSRCLEKRPDQRISSAEELEALLCEAQLEAKIRTHWDDLPLPLVSEPRRAAIAARMPPPLPVPTAKPERAPAREDKPRPAGVATRSTRPLPPSRKAGPDATRPSVGGAVAEEGPVAVKDEEPTRPLMAAAPEPVGVPAAVDSELQTTPLVREPVEPPSDSLRAELPPVEPMISVAAPVRKRSLLLPVMIALIVVVGGGLAYTMLGDVREDGGRRLPAADDKHVTLSAAERAAGRTEERSRESAVDHERSPVDGTEPKTKRRSGDSLRHLPAPTAAEPVAAGAAEDGELPTVDDGASKSQQSGSVEPPTTEEPTVEDTGSAKLANAAPTRDPARGAELARSGQTALSQGQRDRARTLFYQALEHDSRNHVALIGLSDLFFDASEYSKALGFAKRAVAAAPGKPAYLLKLGDAYYKVLKYKEAREAYDKAAKLGSADAKRRLADLDKKLGK